MNVRVIHIEIAVVATDVVACDEPAMETAILLAAQQAATKYIHAITPPAVTMVRAARAGDAAPRPQGVRRIPRARRADRN